MAPSENLKVATKSYTSQILFIGLRHYVKRFCEGVVCSGESLHRFSPSNQGINPLPQVLGGFRCIASRSPVVHVHVDILGNLYWRGNQWNHLWNSSPSTYPFPDLDNLREKRRCRWDMVREHIPWCGMRFSCPHLLLIIRT